MALWRSWVRFPYSPPSSLLFPSREFPSLEFPSLVFPSLVFPSLEFPSLESPAWSLLPSGAP